MKSDRAFAWVLCACMLALAGLWAARAADARPATVRLTLNPHRDTFLGQGIGAAQDAAVELQTGWVYTTRGREFRTYLEFPLDPAAHPPEGLIEAELWLYPEEEPQTSQIAATFVARTMTEPFAEGRVAPSWFSSGDPSVEVRIDRTMDWKIFPVRDLVLEILRAPERAHGIEISGTEMRDNTRWDFLSREGAEPFPSGRQPRLVLFFRDSAFPTATGEPTATPEPTLAPTDPPTAPATATAAETTAPTNMPTATASAAATATGGATNATPEPGGVFLPRALRRH